MIRPGSQGPEVVDVVDGPAPTALPTSLTSRGDGRERIMDVLRAGGLRFRDGARWRPAH